MEVQTTSQLLINQSLAMAHNYIRTARFHEAVSLLNVVQKIDPTNTVSQELVKMIAAMNGMAEMPDLSDMFGGVWSGENLNGKSIEVFCDQGMGDIINMLGYIHLMKTKWDCNIVVVCYAFYDEMQRFMSGQPVEFTKFHKLCDYTTNIFSLPTILSEIKLPVQYPANFALVMEKGIVPHCPPLFEYKTTNRRKKIGVSWKSNPDNELFIKKSIPLDIIKELCSENYDLYSLCPDECPSFMKFCNLKDLQETVNYMNIIDAVVSVDTVVLHLAGACGITTFGLIADDCDPRWGTEGDTTVWYPSVKLVRQNKDWHQAIKTIKEAIESLCNIL